MGLSEPSGVTGRPPHDLEETIRLNIISFVYDQLPKWRDDAERPYAEAESDLNEQLCTFLENAARTSGPPLLFSFHHEVKQGTCRRIDFAAKPLAGFFLAYPYPFSFTNKYEAAVLFEAKRLPAPHKNREKEYLTGGEKMSGGIQRYKTGAHGEHHKIVAMVGYIQKKDMQYHLEMVNKWIEEFSDSSPDSVYWSKDEKLHDYQENNARTARSLSTHDRISQPPISIHHLWVNMTSL